MKHKAKHEATSLLYYKIRAHHGLMVLLCLVGLRYLLEQDFPGMRIGPEPTTDGFIAVMYGECEGVVPGNALVVDPKKPFRKLNAFGNSFLNR